MTLQENVETEKDSEFTEDMCRIWTLTAAHHILPECGILLEQLHRQEHQGREEKHKQGREAVKLIERSRFRDTDKKI